MNWSSYLLLPCLMTVVKSKSIGVDVDAKKYRCGNKIAEDLMTYCNIYNESDDRNRKDEDDRGGHEIVNLCCHNKCSIREMVDYFCTKIEPEYEHLFLNKAKQERTNVILSEKSKEVVKESEELSLVPKLGALLTELQLQSASNKTYKKPIIGFEAKNNNVPFYVDSPHI